MRTDNHLGGEITGSAKWSDDTFQSWVRTSGESSVSFSGHERNHLFQNVSGRHFDDVSGISGIDTPADSRVFTLIDYDRDGWQDIAVVNANAPLLNLYHNQIGRHSAANTKAGQFIAIRFVGGNHTDSSSERFCTRDGYGARATLALGQLTILREHRCGEGLASQNSRTMLVGIGERSIVDELSIKWPNGTIHQTRDVPSGTLLSVYENPADSPNETNFVSEPYLPSSPSDSTDDLRLVEQSALQLSLGDAASGESATGTRAKIQMYTTTATWCAACTQSLPQLRFLRESFREDDLQMWGIPADLAEPPEKHLAYVAEHQPAYTLLTKLKPEEVSTVNHIVTEALHTELLPSTIITDAAGHVLSITAGIPSLSQLRRLVAELDSGR